GVRAGPAGQNIGSGRPDDGNALPCAKRAGVYVLEVRDHDGIADRLVGTGKVDVGRIPQRQGVGPGAAIDRELGAAIGHVIVARSRADDVSPATAVDAVVAGTRYDGVRR